MNSGQFAVLVVAALLVFWAVGAYNRLVALRNAVAAAWQPIDEALTRRAQLLPALIGRLRAPLAAEHGALDAVLAAQALQQTATAAVRALPLRRSGLVDCASAEATLASAQARLLALLEQHSALATETELAQGVLELREIEQRLAFARRWFNDAAQAYDSAIAHLPTRLLVRWFGFSATGRL